MPPRKRGAKSETKAKNATESEKTIEPTEPAAKEEDKQREATDSKNAQDAAAEEEASAKPATNEKPTKKRKKEADNDATQSAPRRSGRGAQKLQPSQEQLLKYMLSKGAEQLCRPNDESQDIQTRGNIRTYSSSVLTPFEELLCAVILSRPISHRLGLRSIRTILNEPYNFTTPKAIQAAGAEKHHQALWDAKTQHKGKTAEQMGQIADVVLEKFTGKGDKDGTQMRKLLDDSNNDIDEVLDTLKTSIKGLGATGLSIFLRRVQWLWEAGYPYVDERTMHSLKRLGLPEEGEALQKLIDEHWSKLDAKDLAGKDEAAKKRRVFVIVLERATGSDLEGQTDSLIEAAAAV